MRELKASHVDALRELFNIGAGRAAAELNEMVESPISLQVPELRIETAIEAAKRWGFAPEEHISSVQLPFSGAFDGKALLGFPASSAAKLVNILSGEEGDDDMNSVRAGTLTEVGNILLNSVMGSIANVVSGQLDYRVPTYYEDTASRVFGREITDNDTVVLAKTRFAAEALAIEGDLTVVFAVGAFDDLLEAIDALEGGAAA